MFTEIARKQRRVEKDGLAADQAVELMIEPLNARDVPHFLLNQQQQAHDIVAEVGAPNLKVQMDLYHCQIAEGDVAMKLRRYLPTGRVGHMQIAGVPERHEPDIGELHLYGCLPDSKQNLRYFVKKSVASLYSALFVDWSGCPDFALAPMHIR